MATNADAYVPSLVLGASIKYCPAREPLDAPAYGQNIVVVAVARREGFAIIEKKGDPRYSDPKRLFLTII